MSNKNKDKEKEKAATAPTLPVASAPVAPPATTESAEQAPVSADVEPPPVPKPCAENCGAVLSVEDVEAGFEVCEACEARLAADRAPVATPGAATAPEGPATGEGPRRLTTEEAIAALEKAGAIAGRAVHDDGKTIVITRGGKRLEFPGDEDKVEAMSDGALLGLPPKDPAAVPESQLQPRALRDLEEMGVIASRRDYVDATCPCNFDGPVPAGAEACPACGESKLKLGKKVTKTVVVTKGGVKLSFPGDEMKAARLTDEALDGVSRKGFPRAGVFNRQ